MQSEQVMFEGERCPIRQVFLIPRHEWVKQLMEDRDNRLRAQDFDRRARESAYLDRHENGLRGE